jgi:hypothetical protein
MIAHKKGTTKVNDFIMRLDLELVCQENEASHPHEKFTDLKSVGKVFNLLIK